MKLIWKEHKRACERMKQADSAVDALTEDLRELSVETEGQTRWWLKRQEQQKPIAARLRRTEIALSTWRARMVIWR